MRGLVPNAISALRIPLAAIFLTAGPSARLLIVVVAASSDWLDGQLARHTGQTTRLGEILDPIADRLFVATALVTLTVEGTIPVWTLPLFLLRDIGVTIGAAIVLLRRHDARLPARRAGKRVTLLQLVGTALVLVHPGLAPVIAIVVALLGALALRDYRRAAQLVVCFGEPHAGRALRRR